MVGVDVATVQVKKIGLELFGQSLVVTGFPGPVRGGVMQAQEKRRARLGPRCHPLHIVHRPVRDQVGEVTFFGALLLAKPEVVGTVG